jgi:tyrosine-protein phosphatase YwqE
MFGLFKRKNETTIQHDSRNWSFLATDMHSHFIPGIDDGPATMPESIALLKLIEQAGYSRIVTTPHISLDYFPDTEPQIAGGLTLLRKAAAEHNIRLSIEAAAEYMIDEGFLSKLRKKENLLSIGNKYILVEMGFVQPSPLLHQAIFEIQAAGFQPVLAHPERYNYYQESSSIAELHKLKKSGCLFQLNTIALSGYYGKRVKIFAEKLLKEELYEFAGSDIHHERHVKALNAVKNSSAFNLLIDYPFLNNLI